MTGVGSTLHGFALQQSKRNTRNSPGCEVGKLHDSHCKNLQTARILGARSSRARWGSRGAGLDRSAGRQGARAQIDPGRRRASYGAGARGASQQKQQAAASERTATAPPTEAGRGEHETLTPADPRPRGPAGEGGEKGGGAEQIGRAHV